MSPASKKNVLLASLLELKSVWDFAVAPEQQVIKDHVFEMK